MASHAYDEDFLGYHCWTDVYVIVASGSTATKIGDIVGW